MNHVYLLPSFCSRYIFITFPEEPQHYQTPSYIERLLLPKRFPILFQKIVRSYERQSNGTSQYRHVR